MLWCLARVVALLVLFGVLVGRRWGVVRVGRSWFCCLVWWSFVVDGEEEVEVLAGRR